MIRHRLRAHSLLNAAGVDIPPIGKVGENVFRAVRVALRPTVSWRDAVFVASQFLERNHLRAPVEHLCHVLTVVGADVKRKIANAQFCGVAAKRADLPKFGMTPLRDPSALQREPTMHGRLHVARNGQ